MLIRSIPTVGGGCSIFVRPKAELKPFSEGISTPSQHQAKMSSPADNGLSEEQKNAMKEHLEQAGHPGFYDRMEAKGAEKKEVYDAISNDENMSHEERMHELAIEASLTVLADTDSRGMLQQAERDVRATLDLVQTLPEEHRETINRATLNCAEAIELYKGGRRAK